VVDLDAIRGNLRVARRLVGDDTAVMAVVKANAYGHGAAMVARAAGAAGAAQLGVATVDEGTALRRAGLLVPILVLGPVDPTEVAPALSARLGLTAVDPAFVSRIEATARRLDPPAPVAVHVKVDTGMRRFGGSPEQALAAARRVAASPSLSLAGLFTHFADADGPDPAFTDGQADLLAAVAGRLEEEGIRATVVHAANSAATMASPRYHLGMVRFGIALYGLPAIAGTPLPDGIRPALTLVSRVARIVPLAPGDTVGYGRTYRAEVPERAALIPVGYADGYRRGLSGRGAMRLGGAVAPVLGRVSMDQTVIGVPSGAAVAPGVPVLVAGGTEPPTSLAHLAGLLDTIPYEVAAGLTARVPRYYVEGGRVVAVEGLDGLREPDPQRYISQ
jgi:alanine racemase